MWREGSFRLFAREPGRGRLDRALQETQPLLCIVHSDPDQPWTAQVREDADPSGAFKLIISGPQLFARLSF